MRAILLLFCSALSLPVFAQIQPETMAWLQRIQSASAQLNYTGTFIYQRGENVETSRITHLADGNNTYEKLETLDGSPREIIRENTEVRFYSPQLKLVRVENRKAWKSFPNLLPANLGGLSEFYVIQKGERVRIAGLDAQAIIFDPRDAMRYGHKLWADMDSGLLLKALLFNERNETIEQFTFTQITPGITFDRDAVKCRWADAAAGWTWETTKTTDATFEDRGWIFKSVPQGFRKISEMKRVMPGKTTEVGHIVLSDGMSAVSVFLEPMGEITAKPHQGVSSQGAVNVYARRMGDYMVTVLGEAPAATIMQIGNSISYKKP